MSLKLLDLILFAYILLDIPNDTTTNFCCNSDLQQQLGTKQTEHEAAIASISTGLQEMQEERDGAIEEKEAKDRELSRIRTNIQKTLQLIKQ